MCACKFDLAGRGTAIIVIAVAIVALFAAAAIGDGVAADREPAIGAAGIGTGIGVIGSGVALFSSVYASIPAADRDDFGDADAAAAIAR